MRVISIVIAILIFGLLILVHEFGHFIMAVKTGVRVNEFSLGMGPVLFSFTKGETRYALKLLPFGGSCAMEGEDGGSDDERAFVNKSVWARIAIVAGGPVFNILMAFVCSVVIVGWFGTDPAVVYDTMEGFPAEEAGIEAGDSIISLNGHRIYLFREVNIYNQIYNGEDLTVVYERDGKRYSSEIKPRLADDGYYYLGITGGERVRGGLLNTLKGSLCEIRYWIVSTYQSLYQLVSGRFGINDLSGPVGIVSYIGDTYVESASDGTKYIIANMINICIMLSANLGVMNLLPIPALDGGRLVFLIIEAVTRKRMDPEKEGKIHFIGLVILLALMVYVMFNDIRGFF